MGEKERDNIVRKRAIKREIKRERERGENKRVKKTELKRERKKYMKRNLFFK